MSELLVQTILLGLAGWRISALLVYERGPYNICLRFREFLGYTHDENGKLETWPGGWREVFSCTWCLSIWSVLAMYGLWQLEPLIVVVIAAATLVIATEKWNSK